MISALHSPQVLVTSKNPVLFRLSSSQWSQPNYFLTSVVEINGAAGQRIINLIEFIFDYGTQQPYAQLDIHRLLDDYLEEIPYAIPTLSENAGRLVDITSSLTCTFFVKHYQTYGTYPVQDPAFLRWPLSGTALCWKGGFSYPNFPQLKYAHDWMLQSLGNSPFLTWKPQSSLIAPSQHEFLSFLNFDSSKNKLRLDYEITYTDGAVESGYFGDYSSGSGKIHRLDVGPAQLDLASIDPNRTIAYYEVWLSNTGNRVSQIRRYYLDTRSYPATRYVYFVNSLGGLDCVRFVGSGEFTADYKRETADRYVGQYDNRYGFIKTLSSQESTGYKINTGYISRAEVHWLRDLFISRQAFILDNDRLLPISVSGKKLSLPEESDVNSLSIEFSFQYENAVFTPFYQSVNYQP